MPEASFMSVPESRPSYEHHFDRAERPFALTTSPQFLFESQSYRAAVEEISYALLRGESIIVVTGDIGTGKTTLCRMIVERRGPRTFATTISSPPRDIDDLLRQVLDAFGLLTDDTREIVKASHYGLLRSLQQFLASLMALSAQVVVIFDEAQRLQPDLLEQIRLLSNLTLGNDRQSLQIILVGQPELEQVLARNDLRQLDQRISRRHRLRPLDPSEVSAYVSRRLMVAQSDESASKNPRFSAAAMRAVATLSQGLPRVVNMLCDRILQSAWEDRTHDIDEGRVIRAARSLKIDVPSRAGVQIERRYGRVAATASTLLIAAVLLWSMRELATSVWGRLVGRASEVTRVVATSTRTPERLQERGPVSTTPVPVAPAQPETSSPKDADRFLIVLSSFRTADRATRLAADVVALGLPAQVRVVSEWHQVVVGPYESREAAVAVQDRLTVASFADSQITPVRRQQVAGPPPAAAVPRIQGASLQYLLAQADVLRQQPNVRELQQIRDEIVRRQQAAPSGDSAQLNAALNELIQDLDEARRRQLEEDGRRFGVRAR